MNVWTWYSCARGKGGSEGHALRDTTTAASVDESDHLTLVNAGDEEVVSQEEGSLSLSRTYMFITVGPMKKL